MRLAFLFRRQRRFEEALTLLEEAGELGGASAEFYLARAELYSVRKNSAAALADIQKLLKAEDTTFFEIRVAARLLMQRDPGSLGEIIQSPAFSRLDIDGQYLVAGELFDSRKGLRAATEILEKLIVRPDITPELQQQVRADLVLALIGQGEYSAALNVIREHSAHAANEFDVAQSFNYSMAQWGLSGSPNPELFRKVIELDEKSSSDTPNRHQCLAIAHWALGESDKAFARIGQAWQRIVTRPMPEFSGWSYLRISHDKFLEDLKEMEGLIRGEAIDPRYIRENRDSEGEVGE
jgi:tetratricopeptide (TPR) repeat protein